MFSLKTDSVALLASLALMASACSDAGGPSTPGQLSFNLATHAASAAAANAPASVAGTPETFSDGSNTLIVSRVELVLRRIELHRAGAADCGEMTSGDCEELELGPILADLPLGTAGAARTFSVQVAPGTYDKLELKIRVPSSGSDAGFRQANPELDNVSVRVTGTYNGTDFVYTSDLEAEMEFGLNPALVANESSATDLTLMVDLDKWFRDQGGILIDPRTANAGGANEILVEQSIKSSLNAFEDDDRDGADDHGPGHGADDGPGHQ